MKIISDKLDLTHKFRLNINEQLSTYGVTFLAVGRSIHLQPDADFVLCSVHASPHFDPIFTIHNYVIYLFLRTQNYFSFVVLGNAKGSVVVSGTKLRCAKELKLFFNVFEDAADICAVNGS